MKNKVFISHASKDHRIIEAFVEHVLKLGLDLPADRIFCTSLEGHGIQSGEYIPDRLREEVHKAKIVLLFISRNYKDSEVCLNELGATWVTLPKNHVVPLLLPDVDFSDLGFLDVNRLGRKLDSEADLLQLIDDMQSQLGLKTNVARLSKQIGRFLELLNETKEEKLALEKGTPTLDDRARCFTHALIPFGVIFQKQVPHFSNGIHYITAIKTINGILNRLSNIDFKGSLWYRFSEGDSHLTRMRYLKSKGRWLIQEMELQIREMWVSISSGLHDEFIMIKGEWLPAYTIHSDVGGESHEVGVLDDGTVVSYHEYGNQHAVFDGKVTDLSDKGLEFRRRLKKSQWFFLITNYHDLGYSYRNTIQFCKDLEAGRINLNKQSLKQLVHNAPGHPTYWKYN